MRPSWRESTWGDEVILNYGKALRNYSSLRGKFRIFGANGPVGWHNEYLSEGPGVILGRKGAYRGVNYSKSPFYVIDTAYFLEPKTPMNMQWLYYNVIYSKLGEIDDGSPIPSTTRAAVYSKKIYVPPYSEQSEIGDFLSKFDDKIELNRKMNETLEQMAQAVFQDWFVDFGPVKRKAKGITDPVAILGGLIPNPAQAQKIASLFPDQFAEDGLPLGSKIIKLQDILELAYGKSLPQKRRVKGPIPVYGSGGITGYHNECLIDGPSIIIGRKGSIGTIYWENSPSFPIDTVFYVKSEFPLIYLYFLLKQFDLKAMNTDAAVPGLNRNNVYRLQIPYLNKTVIEKYASLMTPLFSYCRSNLDQNHTLAEMRDLLLPKLMSGEISVDELEKKMGGVL